MAVGGVGRGLKLVRGLKGSGVRWVRVRNRWRGRGSEAPGPPEVIFTRGKHYNLYSLVKKLGKYW